MPATLGGRANRRFGAGGMVCRLIVPLAAISDAERQDDDEALAARIIATSFGD